MASHSRQPADLERYAVMDQSKLPPATSYPPFTDRARSAIRFATGRMSDDISSLFIVIAAIQEDERIRLAIPKLQLSESILDELAGGKFVDKSVHAKELIMNALGIAKSRNSRAIDTTHILFAAVTSPSPAVLALLAKVSLEPADVANVISKMLDDGDA
jgi:hypothetical protein